jgi:hypothetical protein
VLNVADILYCNYACSQNHAQERTIFAVCSPIGNNGLIMDYLLYC